MFDFIKLQLFAEGGDGASADSGDSGVSTAESDAVLASIPDRAKKFYPKSKPSEKTTPLSEEPKAEETPSKVEQKLSYADLIKSDDYKADHNAYMEKTIGERLKKYKGIEAENKKMRASLETVAKKYGLDAGSESFMDDLASRIDTDTTYYEKYALEHDTTPEEAKRLDSLERKLRESEQAKAEFEKEQEEIRNRREQEEILAQLKASAEKTKATYPDFDLDTEMQDERFRRILSSVHGDTTTAYVATHWGQIIPNVAMQATQKAKEQTVNAIKANGNRPLENGNMANASAVTSIDFRNMNLEQIRAYAEAERRKR